MNLADAEQLAEAAVSPLRGARWAFYALAGLLLAGAIAFVVWWVFIHPGQTKAALDQSKVDASLGRAGGDIATGAIPQINDATRQKVEVDVKIQKGMIDVRQAPDAGVAVHGVSDALRRNLCVHDDLYGADPACQPVHEDPAVVGPAGPDAGSGASDDRR